MALLVHYSTPDEVELANGVATVFNERTSSSSGSLQARLVTQSGAVSVTNPDPNARPEIVVVYGTGGKPVQEQSSSLVPLGSRVLNWPADYQDLGGMLFKVYSNYCGWVNPETMPTNFPVLDFEYKQVAPGMLLVKQVRELPAPAPGLDSPYLLNELTTYWVYQHEGSGVFPNHRAKCRLTLQTENLLLTDTNMASCFYSNAEFEFRENTNLITITGPPASWPGASHLVTNLPFLGIVVEDRWVIGSGANERAYCLRTAIPMVNPAEKAFVPQREMQKWLSVIYATPVVTVDVDLNVTTTNREDIQLIYWPDLSRVPPSAPERFSCTNGLEFQISVYEILGDLQRRSGISPEPPIGPLPLPPLAETRITGLTSEPLVLRDYYSQSAAPGHWSAQYLFEPRLEPALPVSQLRELEAANIQLIHVFKHIVEGVRVTVLGCDGRFRSL
jgi:hypothetical protein